MRRPGTPRVYGHLIDRPVASSPPDLAFGAFSERAPWVVEPDKLPDDVRDQCVVHPSGALLYWLRWLEERPGD